MIVCINQFFKPKFSILGPPGKGNCSVCEKSQENEKCSGYFPINISIIDVEDDKEYAEMC